jgi:hypothetical protein
MTEMPSPTPTTYTLDSGATYTVTRISPDRTRRLCELEGTTERIWVECDEAGTPLEIPRFSSLRAATSEHLLELVAQFDRENRLSRHQAVRFTVSARTCHHAQVELERRAALEGFVSPAALETPVLEGAIQAARWDLGTRCLPSSLLTQTRVWLECAEREFQNRGCHVAV